MSREENTNDLAIFGCWFFSMLSLVVSAVALTMAFQVNMQDADCCSPPSEVSDVHIHNTLPPPAPSCPPPILIPGPESYSSPCLCKDCKCKDCQCCPVNGVCKCGPGCQPKQEDCCKKGENCCCPSCACRPVCPGNCGAKPKHDCPPEVIPTPTPVPHPTPKTRGSCEEVHPNPFQLPKSRVKKTSAVLPDNVI